MKIYPYCFLMFGLLFLLGATTNPKAVNPAIRDAQLDAQPASPTGDTIFYARESEMDQNKRTIVCTGSANDKVFVIGNDFRMRSITLTVYFNVDHRIDHMIADGNVVIEQPSQLTKSGHAVYTQADNKIVLTQSPEIIDNEGHVFDGNTFTIYRSQNKMDVNRSKISVPTP